MLLLQAVVPSLVSAIGWGLCPIFHKLNMNETNNNYIFIFLLHCTIIGILGILVSLFYYSKLKNVSKYKNIKKILVYALLGAFASTILGYYYYFRALAQTKNTLLVVLIVYIVPLVITSIISYFFLGEQINQGMLSGLIISMLGICVFAYYSTKIKN